MAPEESLNGQKPITTFSKTLSRHHKALQLAYRNTTVDIYLYIARQRAIPDFPGNKGPSRISPPCIINPFQLLYVLFMPKKYKDKG